MVIVVKKWAFMAFFNLLIPVVMIICGRMFLKASPKNINYVFGYRTAMSMKNKDTWEFAHKYIGRLWCGWGIALFIITAVLMCFLLGRSEADTEKYGSVISILQIIPLIGAVFPTERALKRTFDKDGHRK